MTEKNPQEKLEDSIKRFLDVYRILSPEARIAFEVEIEKKTRDDDDRTKKLYSSLIKAAKAGMNIEETIKEMKNTGDK